MMIALLTLIWLFTVAVLAFWTLGAWGVASLANVDWGSSAAVETAVRESLGRWLAGTPLEPWLPALTDTIHGVGGALAGAGQWLPAVTWTIWGVGTAMAVVLAVVASVLSAWLVRTVRPKDPTGPANRPTMSQS
jgi:hypothetical protein